MGWLVGFNSVVALGVLYCSVFFCAVLLSTIAVRFTWFLVVECFVVGLVSLRIVMLIVLLFVYYKFAYLLLVFGVLGSLCRWFIVCGFLLCLCCICL